jgi:hypothetical protein
MLLDLSYEGIVPELGDPRTAYKMTSNIQAEGTRFRPVSVFCTSKIHGGQDRVFQFRGGLANN